MLHGQRERVGLSVTDAPGLSLLGPQWLPLVFRTQTNKQTTSSVAVAPLEVTPLLYFQEACTGAHRLGLKSAEFNNSFSTHVTESANSELRLYNTEPLPH